VIDKKTTSIEQVTVVSVPVSDQDRAKDFYVGKLGFEVIREDTSIPSLRWLQVGPRSGSCSLTLVTWFDSMPAGSLQGLVLRTSDLQGDYERLASLGVEFEEPPQQQPWGTETVMHDPDGNRLVLQQI
jgi:catechol 2,3-dioxygenase-like lactoylglutathione lyase family enzyme